MTDLVRSPDRITRVALFGVRFRDVATRAPISEGLEVCVYRAREPKRSIAAVQTRSGAFAVYRVPGLERLDLGEGDDQYWTAAPAKAKPVIVEVRDRLKRFHDFSFRTSLPLRDVYQPGVAVVAVTGVAGYVPLFPTCQRTPPAATAVVHAHLHDDDADRPAAYALLRVDFKGKEVGLGIADKEGKVAAMFPYPVPARPAAAPPPGLGAAVPPPELFSWDLDLKLYNGHLTAPSPERISTLPDLDDLLAQRNLPASRLRANLTPVTVLAPLTALGPQSLSLGNELVVKTSDSPSSYLHVLPA